MATNNFHYYTGDNIIRFFYGMDGTRKSTAHKLMLIIADKYFDGVWESPEDCIREMDAILGYALQTVNSGCAACYTADIRDECIAAGYSNSHSDTYFINRYSEVLTDIATTIKRYANTYFDLCQVIATNQ